MMIQITTQRTLQQQQQQHQHQRRRISSSSDRRRYYYTYRGVSDFISSSALLVVVYFGCFCCCIITTVTTVEAVLPQLAIDIRTVVPSSSSTSFATTKQTFYASHALFGPIPHQLSSNEQQSNDNNADPYYSTIRYPPSENRLLCTTVTTSETSYYNNSILLVPRGTCTFETKVRNGQLLGASSVIIHGALASRYAITNGTNTSSSSSSSNSDNNNDDTNKTNFTKYIDWPKDKYDYDCTKGRALIPLSKLSFDPLPYNSEVNDPILGGSISASLDDNLCYTNSPDKLQYCPSKQCLITGKQLSSSGQEEEGDVMEVCCAWDLHIWLYPDTTAIPSSNTTTPTNDTTPEVVPITIPAAYITTEQAMDIMNSIHSDKEDGVVVKGRLYARWRPKYNSSAYIIWLLGSCIAAVAAYLTASDYHTLITDVKNDNNNNNNNNDTTAITSPSRRQQQQRRSEEHEQLVLAAANPAVDNTNNTNNNQEIVELTPIHALGFVIMASTSLLVLFYFKIYGIVKIMYAIGCSTAVSQIALVPLLAYIFRTVNVRNLYIYRSTSPDAEIGDITLLDVVAFSIGYTMGLVWLYMAVFVRDSDTYLYFWLSQDIFGACMCISFLKVIRLNSIRVAAILLIVAFFYDIFFVFITPLLTSGGKSVMITVATSGGPPKADALWCEKYPNDVDCQGGTPMPMLLAIPRFHDFVGGSSLLGLGDIVLPGLLLSFAARYDAAKSLIGIIGGGRGTPRSMYTTPATTCPEQHFIKWCTCCTSAGYYPAVCIAYAIGLAMANIAVYVMQMGQPALLYLVPCCLGTLVYCGYRRNELQDLWDGPRILKIADDYVYASLQQQSQQQYDGQDQYEQSDQRTTTNGTTTARNIGEDSGLEETTMVRVIGGTASTASTTETPFILDSKN